MKKEKVLLDYSMHGMPRNELLFNLICNEIASHYLITDHVVSYIMKISEFSKECIV